MPVTYVSPPLYPVHIYVHSPHKRTGFLVTQSVLPWWAVGSHRLLKNLTACLFPLLIQGGKVTPVKSEMLPNLRLWLVNLPSVFGNNNANILLKSFSVLQIQIAVDRHWRWLVNVEIRQIFSFVEKLVDTMSRKLYSCHHTSQASLCQVFHGLYMLCWISNLFRCVQLAFCFYLAHICSGIRLRHWKPMSVRLPIKQNTRVLTNSH